MENSGTMKERIGFSVLNFISIRVFEREVELVMNWNHPMVIQWNYIELYLI